MTFSGSNMASSGRDVPRVCGGGEMLVVGKR
jgi:hypothetical protein